MPDSDGKLADVVLGFDSLDGYVKAIRTLGRSSAVWPIASGTPSSRWRASATRSTRTTSRTTCTAAGRGWDKVVWNASAIDTAEGPALELTYVSKDGEEGYPGTVTAKTVYTLTNDNELKVEMQATTDKTTLVNMAHHSYWNLGGHNSGTILDHELTLYADQYTPGTPMVPDGRINR